MRCRRTVGIRSSGEKGPALAQPGRVFFAGFSKQCFEGAHHSERAIDGGSITTYYNTKYYSAAVVALLLLPGSNSDHNLRL